MKPRGRAERDGRLPSRQHRGLPREPKGAAGDWTEKRGACDERRGKEPAQGRPEASAASRVTKPARRTSSVFSFSRTGWVACILTTNSLPAGKSRDERQDRAL